MIIYCDMDGVLANFNAVHNAVQRFETEENFFFNLKPYKRNVNALKKLMDKTTVYILSASPNERCDQDKRKWLKKYIPDLNDDHIIIMRNGQNKADFAKPDCDINILFDDYGKNCRQWNERPDHQAYQIGGAHTINYYVKSLGM